MIADYHIHSPFCKHAEGTFNDLVAAARQMSLDEICFTDHAPAPDGYDPANRMEPDQFPAYARAVAEVQGNEGPVVLFGIEADYYPGCEAFLSRWLRETEFDLVMGSIHYIRNWGFDNSSERRTWDSVDVEKTWREYFCLVAELADSGMYDVVGHFDLPKKFGYRASEGAQKDMAGPALDRVAEAGMTLEINTSGLRRPVKEIYPSLPLLRLARERDIPICLGSDAHRPQEVAYAFTEALEMVRKAGYTHCVRYRKRRKTLVPLGNGA